MWSKFVVWALRWWTFNWRRLSGGLFFIAGLCLTIWLAIRSSATNPPTSGESASYVVLAAFFQLAAAFFFAQSGRPDGTHVGQSVQRIYRLAARVGRLSVQARSSAGQDTAPEIKRNMDILAAELAYLTDDTLDAMTDWEVFSPDARRKIKEIQKGTDE